MDEPEAGVRELGPRLLDRTLAGVDPVDDVLDGEFGIAGVVGDLHQFLVGLVVGKNDGLRLVAVASEEQTGQLENLGVNGFALAVGERAQKVHVVRARPVVE